MNEMTWLRKWMLETDRGIMVRFADGLLLYPDYARIDPAREELHRLLREAKK